MNDAGLTRPRTEVELRVSADPLSEVLQLLNMSGVLYCNATLTAPWGIELPDLPGVMNVHVVTSGHCWLEMEGEAPLYMPEGSLVLIPRGRSHRLVGNPGDRVTPLNQVPIQLISDRFEVMNFGGGGEITGITYYGVRFDPYLADKLIELLPERLHLRTRKDDSWLRGTVAFIAAEANNQQPGSETVITRLADILVIQVIRTWLESAREVDKGWIAALHDKYIGKAMSLMHRNPGYDWQVSTLAREVGMSRSGFSARFTGIAGESVLNYLTKLRMQLARRELTETTDSLAVIAERVGYHSEPAFNRAFKRVIGQTPGSLRKN